MALESSDPTSRREYRTGWLGWRRPHLRPVGAVRERPPEPGSHITSRVNYAPRRFDLDTLLLLLRLALSLVFVVAAVGKLNDRDGTRGAVIQFGAPYALSGIIAALLPVAELATALLLIVSATAWV